MKFTGSPSMIHASSGLPPCGGSGLKCPGFGGVITNVSSPSVWREWIEMDVMIDFIVSHQSPSVWREWIEISSGGGSYKSVQGLPPCGGSGLK